MHFDYRKDAPLDFTCKSFISRERLCRHRDVYMGRAAAALAVYSDGITVPKKSDAAEYLYRMPSSALPRGLRQYSKELKESAGEYICHRSFFSSIYAEANLTAEALKAIEESFGSMEQLRYLFTKRANEEKASGFLRICENRRKKLKIIFTPGYSLPASGLETKLCLDLWEHSYTETFGCDCGAYAAAFLSCVDFSKICT